jgi:hypothetical protein
LAVAGCTDVRRERHQPDNRIISLAAHLGYDELVAGHIAGGNGGNVGVATIVLYLVVTLAVQQFLLLARVKWQEAMGEVPTSY